jgi:hypothetical protein
VPKRSSKLICRPAGCSVGGGVEGGRGAAAAAAAGSGCGAISIGCSIGGAAASAVAGIGGGMGAAVGAVPVSRPSNAAKRCSNRCSRSRAPMAKTKATIAMIGNASASQNDKADDVHESPPRRIRPMLGRRKGRRQGVGRADGFA